MDPFFIEGPAVISFSGGRTSGYMLRRVLDSGLQPDVHVLFCNTSKEFPATYEFVRRISEEWGVKIRWLEWRPKAPYFEEVDHLTAKRKGEVFSALIEKRSYLPNAVQRFCTAEMKVLTMKRWMKAQGYEHWTNVVGIRADEPRRVVNMRSSDANEPWDNVLPLAQAGVFETDVFAFWRSQPFDLGLMPYESNCDLCFLKASPIRARIIRDNPGTEDWWIAQERNIGGTFRKEMSYAGLQQMAECALPLDLDDTRDALGACTCHD